MHGMGEGRIEKRYYDTNESDKDESIREYLYVYEYSRPYLGHRTVVSWGGLMRLGRVCRGLWAAISSYPGTMTFGDPGHRASLGREGK